MNIEDLPRPKFSRKTFNRNAYNLFWLPFQIIFEFPSAFLAYSSMGFKLTVVTWLFFIAFLFFSGMLTTKVAVGLAIIAVLAWAGMALLLALLRLIF